MRVAIAQFDGATSLRVPPLAAGLLVSTLRRRFGDAVALRIHVRRSPVEEAARQLAEADLAGLSLYAWNAAFSLAVARRARELRPAMRIVAGGPSVPRRPEAYAAFLAAHPWIEALVLGEGEVALGDVVAAVRAGSSLSAIAGVIARDGDAVVAGPVRPRLEREAFEALGSPYLDGTFDDLVASGELSGIHAVVLETNRGCPFSCAFCDWGQATQSKVNEIPMDRVERELAWIGERRVPYLYLVDANFGIRRRDVEITESIGKTAQRHGAPGFVFFHLTKNATAKNLKTVEILRDHGVGTQVALSMQDFDPEVLVAIKRDNIRPAAALALREHCHDRGLSTVNELMLGLPAQTARSIRASVVSGITPFPKDTFFLYPTRVLENAEMAEPAYRARHGLVTRQVPQWSADPAELPHVVEHEEIIVATRTLTVDEWSSAFAFGYLLSALWNHRLLQTAIHVIQFGLGRDLAGFVDALLASRRPHLAAVRAGLDRFARAILDEAATTLPVAGWGETRREPADAVCAVVYAAGAAIYAEIADEAAAWIAGAAARGDFDGSTRGDSGAAARGGESGAARGDESGPARGGESGAARGGESGAARGGESGAAPWGDSGAAAARASDAALAREAVAWDALQLPAATPTSRTADFAFDWPAYERAMSSRPRPIARATCVRVTATPPPDAPAEVLLSWHMRARTTIEPASPETTEVAP